MPADARSAPPPICFTMHGIGVSDGIAIGHAHLFAGMSAEVDHYTIAAVDVAPEQRRYDRAVKEVREELEELAESVRHGGASELAAFMRVHIMLLDDHAFAEAPRERIRAERRNAEWALRQELDGLLGQFGDVADPYLRERAADVRQVAERVLAALAGTQRRIPAKPAREDGSILVARDLSPADVILFKRHRFTAFVTDLGGLTSHTAIVARSLDIPAIVALHHARSLIREDELIIVDGTQGVVIVNPGRQVLAEYRLKQNEFELARQKLRRLRSKRAETLDGEHVELYANIELPEDVEPALANGASGIGLFRSEFLFLNREGLPSEDEQFEAYRKVAAGMQGKPVTIRTFDLGADKQPEEFDGLARVAPNPALGLRAVRFCLAEPRLFLTQLRAILRATHHGNVRILIPMLASVAEIDQTLALIERAKETLREQGVPFDASVKVGGMIEIPAAVLAMGAFLRKLDFLSIGTNDLIQYTLAVDRADDAVSHLYDPLHPAVLRLIGLAIGSATKARVPIAVCGEMAGDVALTRLFLGFGLREFSMHPSRLLGVKQRVLQTNVAANAPLIERIRRTDEPERLNALLAKLDA